MPLTTDHRATAFPKCHAVGEWRLAEANRTTMLANKDGYLSCRIVTVRQKRKTPMHKITTNAMALLAIFMLTITALAAEKAPEKSKEPVLVEPDKSVTIPERLKEEAEACFAKGYTYFIWAAEAGPVKRGESNVLLVTFFYVAKGEPKPFQTAFVLIVKKEGSGELLQQTGKSKPDGFAYSSAGKSFAMHFDLFRSLRGKGTAKVHLLDAATGEKQISNDFSIEIEL